MGSFEEVMTMYQELYIPGQQIYMAAEQPSEKVDVLLFNNDIENPRLFIQQP